jgi:hypothetical protein
MTIRVVLLGLGEPSGDSHRSCSKLTLVQQNYEKLRGIRMYDNLINLIKDYACRSQDDVIDINRYMKLSVFLNIRNYGLYDRKILFLPSVFNIVLSVRYVIKKKDLRN